MKLDKSGLYTIGTDEARELLTHNYLHNRSVVKSSLEKIKADMEGSKFIWNGEPIIVHRDGTLLDGQHRLMAIAETGMSVPLSVSIVDGDKDEIYRSIDKGSARTFSQSLNTSSEAAAITKVMCCIEYSSVPAMSAVQGKMESKRVATHAEMAEYFLDNKDDIEKAGKIGKGVTKALTGSASGYGIAYYISKRLYGQKADEFFIELKDLASTNQYASATAKSILKARADKRLQKNDVLGMTLMGFKAYASGSKVPKCFNKGDKYIETVVEEYRREFPKEA